MAQQMLPSNVYKEKKKTKRLFLTIKGQKKGQGERDRTEGMNEYVTERGERGQ